MIVDSHVHVLPARMRLDRAGIAGTEPWFALCHEGDRVIATADELISAMDEDGVDVSVCYSWPFATAALCSEANEHLAEVQRQHPTRVVAYAIINPTSPDVAQELQACVRLGLRGVGELNCDAQGFSLDDPAVDTAVEASVALGLPWTLHCSEPLGHEYPGKGTTTPDKVVRFASRHPELQLVCAHLGGGLPFYAHMPEVAAVCRGLWFDTAAGPFLYAPSAYRDVVQLCGADRLLYGSDYPLLRAPRYRTALESAGLDARQMDLVMGGAAASLLRL